MYIQLRKWKPMIFLGILVAAFLFAAAGPAAEENTVAVIESDVKGDFAELFLAGAGAFQNPTVQISGEKTEIQESGIITQSNIPKDILFLIDTSTSILPNDQTRILDLLEGFLSSKGEKDHFALMTFGKERGLLCDFTNDRFEFQQAAKSLQFQEEGSSFYTAIKEAVSAVKSQKALGHFAQIIAITDGVEYDESGITQDEMFSFISQNPIPIHTLGCTHANNGEQLKSLYAIARISGGIFAALDNKSVSSDLVSSLASYENTIYRICFAVPTSLQDGSVKTVGIYSNNNAQAAIFCDLRMPMTEKEEEPLPQAPIQEVPIEPKKKPILIWIAAVGFLLVIAAVVLYIFIKRRKNNLLSAQTSSSLSESIPIQEEKGKYGQTEICSSGDTQMLMGDMGEMEDSITLVCVSNPYSRFEISIDSPVIIGRNAKACNIVIDSDKSVSGRHCKIYAHNREIYIEDLDSLNHTFVNGEEIHNAIRLHPKDILKFGRIEYEIRFNE